MWPIKLMEGPMAESGDGGLWFDYGKESKGGRKKGKNTSRGKGFWRM